MQNSQNKKALQIGLFVLIAVVTLGIGYAAISAINLFINGNATASVNQNNFKVYFTSTADTPSLTGNVTVEGTAEISSQDNTVATFNVGGLTKVGDYAIATYTVLNDSEAIGAEISLNVTSSNSEYFKATETILDNKLQAGDTTLATVKVEMIKTPINNDVTTSVTARLIATPLENANATGGSPASKASDDPVSFATDSWATIKKAVQDNNTSVYNVGDTKIVSIDGTDYTVRVVNKTTNSSCNNSDYSETACGFVVEFESYIRAMNMRDSGTNDGGYSATLVYDYLVNTLYEKFPQELQAAIKPTRVISGLPYSRNHNIVLANLYLFSEKEVFGTDYNDNAADTTTQLEYYVNNSSRKNFQSNFYDGWWLRTAGANNRTGFCYVDQRGELKMGYATNSYYVSPAFRIG